jgi:hypothetical protein
VVVEGNIRHDVTMRVRRNGPGVLSEQCQERRHGSIPARGTCHFVCEVSPQLLVGLGGTRGSSPGKDNLPVERQGPQFVVHLRLSPVSIDLYPRQDSTQRALSPSAGSLCIPSGFGTFVRRQAVSQTHQALVRQFWIVMLEHQAS